MSYKKNCNRCNQQILMDNPNGKWRALELDGSSTHVCKEQNQNTHYTPEQQKEFVESYRPSQPQPQPKKQITLEDLEFRISKIEKKLLEVFGE